MQDLIDFLNKYNVSFNIENDIVVANNSYIKLYFKNIDKLPDSIGNLKCETLDLSSNWIQELPDSIGNLKCHTLDLSANAIKRLPDTIGNLKCEMLDLSYNQIKKLPDSIGNLKCETLDLSNNPYNGDVNHREFESVEITDAYIFCDGILTCIESRKQLPDFDIFIGYFNNYVVSDRNGVFAHGNSIRQCISDILFKKSNRDTSKYKGLPLSHRVTIEDAIVMYRSITGACSGGVENFLTNLKTELGKTISIGKIIAITKNKYNSEVFESFFNMK